MKSKVDLNHGGMVDWCTAETNTGEALAEPQKCSSLGRLALLLHEWDHRQLQSSKSVVISGHW